jgi:hypothetical protein
LVAGGLDGVGHAVVLPGLPDDRVGVVLAAVVDGHPDAQGQGGLAVADGLGAVGIVLVGGDPELGIEPLEGLLALTDQVAVKLGVAVADLVWQAGVVVTVAGIQIAAEAAGDVVGRPVAELMAAPSGWGLEMRQQLLMAVADLAVLVGPVQIWPLGSGGV